MGAAPIAVVDMPLRSWTALMMVVPETPIALRVNYAFAERAVAIATGVFPPIATTAQTAAANRAKPLMVE
jgi:hypothetical protein